MPENSAYFHNTVCRDNAYNVKWNHTEWNHVKEMNHPVSKIYSIYLHKANTIVVTILSLFMNVFSSWPVQASLRMNNISEKVKPGNNGATKVEFGSLDGAKDGEHTVLLL